ncbi:XRE family transcriptional regulator [Amycolatopsis sp. H20-H5]|uniref:XRE family transcriptional regulator n=1 Tax=Amycolatopsis sp. H20-H5 TaxID=3046309 RepID=UPI002DBED4DA|nr:XRE family transcriptional regulator [Amycolatopsis sp. H20-H5]MEC3978439.1 XRE family transcriptional regulator [Amycolatopsis sp. H20-H5]
MVGGAAFADALRGAIEARGLGLGRIRERLAHDGISVSLATLSYWQSGRSRPERHSSLKAVARLEYVLELPSGALSGLLPPPRRRGRWVNESADKVDLCAFWPRAEQIAAMTAEVDTRWDERLTRLSQHDRVTVGPDGGERSYVSRQVLRAEADGPDRWVVILHLDEHDRPVPVVRALRNCRVGRVVARPEDGLVVAELLFARPLRRGETVITEHELVNEGPAPRDGNYERKFRLPVREYVLEIGFDPGRIPARVTRFVRGDDGTEQAEDVSLDGGHEVHGVALSFGPGYYGFRWEWD